MNTRIVLMVAALAGSAPPMSSAAGTGDLKQELGGLKLVIENTASSNTSDGAGINAAAPGLDGVRVTNHEPVAVRCALLRSRSETLTAGASTTVIAPGQSATLRLPSGTVDTQLTPMLKCERGS